MRLTKYGKTLGAEPKAERKTTPHRTTMASAFVALAISALLTGCASPPINGKSCQVSLPRAGTGPGGCLTKEDVRRLCSDARECGYGGWSGHRGNGFFCRDVPGDIFLLLEDEEKMCALLK